MGRKWLVMPLLALFMIGLCMPLCAASPDYLNVSSIVMADAGAQSLLQDRPVSVDGMVGITSCALLMPDTPELENSGPASILKTTPASTLSCECRVRFRLLQRLLHPCYEVAKCKVTKCCDQAPVAKCCKDECEQKCRQGLFKRLRNKCECETVEVVRIRCCK